MNSKATGRPVAPRSAPGPATTLASDATRWQAAWQVLTARGFHVHRAMNSDGVMTYTIRRWGHERVLHSLDDLAAFVRVACVTEARS